jgi:membrane dipeptidase
VSRRRVGLIAVGAAGVAGAAALASRPVGRRLVARAEARHNPLHRPAPSAPSAEAAALHATLTVADLHADTLLWGRDLFERGTQGHSDVPRMIEGNVALQVLAVTTKSPRNLDLERNDDRTDDVTLLAMASGWPVATWTSLRARALHQARRAEAFADRSDGLLRIVRTAADLDRFLADRAGDPSLCAVVLAIEGAQCLEGDPANVDVLADTGYRMISPAHFFDTEMGGSAHGMVKGGLTEAGRQYVRRCEARGVLVDIAHASPATIRDILGMAERPILASHTGLRRTCDNTRNLTDEHAIGVAETGGVLGIGFWDTVCGGQQIGHVARAIADAVELVGAEHVALGSDWDGGVGVPFDASETGSLTQALLDVGLDEPAIRAVMGENVVRLFREVFPAGG